MIPDRLYVDGNILAVRSRVGTGIVHCATLNIGALGPQSYSWGARCGVGNAGLVALGLWLDRNTEWRRCAKCVRLEDARLLLAIEHGGAIPQKPIVLREKFRTGHQSVGDTVAKYRKRPDQP